MVYYFSGTGNSRYVACGIASRLSAETLSIPDADPAAASGQPTVIVTPVYSWGIPPIVLRFVERIPEATAAKAFFVLTCGDETGRAPEMLISHTSKLPDALPPAIWSIIMPNNYVLLPGFDVDPQATAERKLAEAPKRIAHIADRIAQGIREIDVHRGPWPTLKTRLVYPLFRRWGIFPSRFRAEGSCIGCGKCAAACPAGNIRLADNRRPEWGAECTSCLACFHICPVNAVQYGAATRKKGQYFCPKEQ